MGVSAHQRRQEVGILPFSFNLLDKMACESGAVVKWLPLEQSGGCQKCSAPRRSDWGRHMFAPPSPSLQNWKWLSIQQLPWSVGRSTPGPLLWLARLPKSGPTLLHQERLNKRLGFVVCLFPSLDRPWLACACVWASDKQSGVTRTNSASPSAQDQVTMWIVCRKGQNGILQNTVVH